MVKKQPDMMAIPQMHMKSHGIKAIIIGILVILNQMYAIVDWATFIGAVLILVGLVKLMPCCKK